MPAAADIGQLAILVLERAGPLVTIGDRRTALWR
jgi:hypothetical protein